MPKFSGAVSPSPSRYLLRHPLVPSSIPYQFMQCMQARREMCVISLYLLKHPQTSTNPSQTLLLVYKLAHLPLPHPKSSPPRPPQPLAQPFAQMCYRCKYQVSSTGPNILEVYIIYLHVYMCQYMKVLVKLLKCAS